MPKSTPAPNRVRTMRELSEDAETAATVSSIVPMQTQNLVLLPFSRIRHFVGHPFRLYTGERLADMTESIRQNGILVPIIVRRIYNEPDFDYEILAGHNRMNAGCMPA